MRTGGNMKTIKQQVRKIGKIIVRKPDGIN